MDDLISRAAAIDAIHCNIVVTGRENAELVAKTMGEFVDRIKALPTIQPEQPIIKCKDCKWWKKQKDSAQGRCRLLGIYPTGAWYCANAKRRSDD